MRGRTDLFNSLESVTFYESIETLRKRFVMDLNSEEQQNAINRFVQKCYPAVPDLIEEYYMWHYVLLCFTKILLRSSHNSIRTSFSALVYYGPLHPQTLLCKYYRQASRCQFHATRSPQERLFKTCFSNLQFDLPRSNRYYT
jgi:hypothetical protein